MLFGPTTNGDLLTWQCQAARVLTDLLRDAIKQALPYVHWQLGHGKTLVATCTDTDMKARRTAFTRWANFLGIHDWRSWDGLGVTRMHGIAKDFNGVRVVISADLYAGMPEGGDQP